MDWKLELVAIPVTDVDRAKAFYADQVGFNADHDHVGQRRDALRAADAARIGLLDRDRQGRHRREPGSVQGMQLVVADIEAAHAQLAERGVEVSDVQDFPWGRFVFFSDPDGNGWAVPAIGARVAALAESGRAGSARRRLPHARTSPRSPTATSCSPARAASSSALDTMDVEDDAAASRSMTARAARTPSSRS